MSGMGYLEGGWEFVWTAYGISAVVYLGYAASVLWRYRAERSRAAREAKRAGEVAS